MVSFQSIGVANEWRRVSSWETVGCLTVVFPINRCRQRVATEMSFSKLLING